MIDKKNFIRSSKLPILNLRQVDPKDDKNFFNLSWTTKSGYPKVTVFLNNPDNSERVGTAPFDYNNMIVAPLTTMTLSILIDNFKTIYNGKRNVELTIDCYKNVFENNIIVKDKTIISGSLSVGKDKNGIIYIKLSAHGKREAKMELHFNSKYYKCRDMNGDVITDKSILSMMFAKSYFDILSRTLTAEVSSTVVEEYKDKVRI